MNSKKAETLVMAELYRNGRTLKQIAARYGIAPESVGSRFSRLGADRPPRPSSTIAFDKIRLNDLYTDQRRRLPDIARALNVSVAVVQKSLKLFGISKRKRAGRNVRHAQAITLDKIRLANLYTDEALAVRAIARALNVTPGVVKYALEWYGIPKRPPITRSKYPQLLENMRMGDQIVIECPAHPPRSAILRAALSLGIKVTTEKLNGDRLRITRIEGNAASVSRESAQILARINKRRLGNLYTEERWTLLKIAAVFGVDPSIIARALELYRLPPRPPLKHGGKYVTLFRQLNIGETVEIECAAKYPMTNLHSIAGGITIKISVRRPRRGDRSGRFTVTRIA